MATYNKPKILTRIDTLMGGEFEGDANAFEALKAHKIAKAEAEGNEVLIPFHAVKEFWKEVTAEEATKADAYCK